LLLDSIWQHWLADLEEELSTAVDASASPIERGDQLAAALATSLGSRPVLCDLIGAQAAVLERNVSPQVAAEYKRAALANVAALGHLALGCVGELGEHDSVRLAGAAMMVTGALWPHTQPSAAMLAASARAAAPVNGIGLGAQRGRPGDSHRQGDRARQENRDSKR